MPRLLTACTLTAAALVAGLPCAHAQTISAQPAVETSSIRPERATLLKMQRKITVKFEDNRLEDVMKFFKDVTQADIEAIWTDNNVNSLDKEKKITLSMTNQPALYVLEAVLEKARVDFGENAWQMDSAGTLVVGSKEALNKSRRIVMYDINDLLHVIPRYNQVPQIDLNSVLQGGQGGGGQSPFSGDDTNTNQNTGPDREERAKKIIDLIIQLVEPNQWVDNGGEAATIRFFNGVLIVNAPDYVHRQLNGYPYWPSTTTRIASTGQRRWVTLNMDTGNSQIDGIRQTPVTAVVNGQPVSSAPQPKPGAQPPAQQPAPKP